MRARALVKTALLAAAVFSTPATVAQAATTTPTTINGVVVTTPESAAISSTLTIKYNHPKTASEVKSQLAGLGVNTETLNISGDGQATASTTPSPTSAPLPQTSAKAPKGLSTGVSTTQGAGPQAAYLYCNRSYSWTDGDGTFGVQRSCSYKTVPWYYTISGAVRAIIDGPVTEHGIVSSVNGDTRGRGAEHIEGSGYLFHGTFNPVPANSYLTYWDQFDFPVADGNGSIVIHGSMTVSSVPTPCSASTSLSESTPQGTC